MSKGDSGPTANSFPNARKSGWMFKQGGSGFGTHWRKRWFVADHHYLFYYKNPNDKKPVGILCLPEYESCHTLDSKVCKKPNSFMLDRGNVSQDPATKDYILYTESKEETEAWIKAITEEIKPILGQGMPNGHPAMRGGKKGDEVKIDQKALDEVTKAVSEGPKLSHPTAQRPRVRGRRPPKRYAVFHEDDSKEETPPNTPPGERRPSQQPESPSSSPAPSPATAAKRGHRPSVPLKPKLRSASGSKLIEDKEAEKLAEQLGTITETEARVTSNTRKSPRPLPPKKPPKEQDSTISLIPTRPSPPPRPVPAKRHSRDEGVVNAVEPPSISKPTPPKKPRPQPPAKPRTSTSAIELPTPTEPSPPPQQPSAKPRASLSSTNPIELPPTPTEPSPPPQQPSAKPRASLSSTNPIELPPTPTEPSSQTRPVPTSRPVPVPRRRTKAQDSLDEDVKSVSEKVNEKEPKVFSPSPPVPKTEEEAKVELEVPAEVEEKEDKKPAQEEIETEEEGTIYENVEIASEPEEPTEEKATRTVHEPSEKDGEASHPEVVPSSPKAQKTPDYISTATPSPEPTADEDKAVVEPAPEAAAKEEVTATLEVIGEKESILSPSYELMDPSSPLKSDPVEPKKALSPSEDDYEPMEFGVGAEHSLESRLPTTPVEDKLHEYEEPTEWQEEAMPLSPEYAIPPDADYAVPPPPRLASGFSTYDVPKSPGPSPELIPPDNLRPSSRAATTPSPPVAVVPQEQKRRSETDPVLSAALGNDTIAVSVLEAVSDTSSASRCSSTTSDTPKQLERDALGVGKKAPKPHRKAPPPPPRPGYTKILKKSDSLDARSGISYSMSGSNPKSNETAEGIMVEKGSSQLESSLDTIPATVKQAREILRLAKAVKAEAEEMKSEVHRELQLARRERHDAELLKKNAGEILRMAKERLHAASIK